MKKKLISVLLTVVMALSLLSGCGFSSKEKSEDAVTDSGVEQESTAEDSAVDGDTAESTDEEQVTISFQWWAGGGEEYQQVIKDFEEETGIKVEFTSLGYADHIEKLKVDLATGGGPDVYCVQEGAYLEVFRDFEMELSGHMEETFGADWISDFTPYCISVCQGTDGGYYAMPIGLQFAGFYWANQNILDKYGLEVPTSRDDLKAAAKVLRDNGEFPFTIGAKDTWVLIDVWLNIAADINNEKLYAALEGEVPFTDPELVESFEIWQSLFTEGVFQDGAFGMTVYNDTNDMYSREGSLALHVNGSWVFPDYIYSDPELQAIWNAEDSNHQVFNIDWNNDGKTAPVQASTGQLICVNKNTENAEAALKFMDYMVTEAFMSGSKAFLFNSAPSRVDQDMNYEGLSEDALENLSYIKEYSDSNTGGYREMQYAELKEVIINELSNLGLGDVTPEEAAATIEAASQAQAR